MQVQASLAFILLKLITCCVKAVKAIHAVNALLAGAYPGFVGRGYSKGTRLETPGRAPAKEMPEATHHN